MRDHERSQQQSLRSSQALDEVKANKLNSTSPDDAPQSVSAAPRAARSPVLRGEGAKGLSVNNANKHVQGPAAPAVKAPAASTHKDRYGNNSNKRNK